MHHRLRIGHMVWKYDVIRKTGTT